MSSSRIEIKFELCGESIPAIEALKSPDPPFPNLCSDLARLLNDRGDPASIPVTIDWGDRFQDTEHPEYIDAICAHAASLRTAVVEKVSGYLASHGANTDCSLSIGEITASTCRRCGTNCHEVGNKKYTSCPGSPPGGETLTLSQPRGDGSLDYQVEVKFKYYFGDCGCEHAAPALAPAALAAAAARPDPRDLARDLHLYYVAKGKFPPFWRLFDNDLRRLERIFAFFEEMDQERIAAPRELTDLMCTRLNDRFNKRPATKARAEARPMIQAVAERLVAALGRLDTLVGPAFDNFASGSLAVPFVDPQGLRANTSALKFPEPDGYMFFCWSEFAFLALEQGVAEEAPWRAFLPVALRAQRIFAHTYGDPERRGKPPAYMSARYYQPSTYRPIDPSAVAAYDFADLADLPECEQEMNRCIQFAFPGGMN